MDRYGASHECHADEARDHDGPDRRAVEVRRLRRRWLKAVDGVVCESACLEKLELARTRDGKSSNGLNALGSSTNMVATVVISKINATRVHAVGNETEVAALKPPCAGNAESAAWRFVKEASGAA